MSCKLYNCSSNNYESIQNLKLVANTSINNVYKNQCSLIVGPAYFLNLEYACILISY